MKKVEESGSSLYDVQETVDFFEGFDLEMGEMGLFQNKKELKKDAIEAHDVRDKISQTEDWEIVEKRVVTMTREEILELLDDANFLMRLNSTLFVSYPNDLSEKAKMAVSKLLKLLKEHVTEIQIKNPSFLQHSESEQADLARGLFVTRLELAPLIFNKFLGKSHLITLETLAGKRHLTAEGKVDFHDKYIPFNGSIDSEKGQMDTRAPLDLFLLANNYSYYSKNKDYKKAFLTILLRLIGQAQGIWYSMDQIMKKQEYIPLWEDIIEVAKKSSFWEKFYSGESVVGTQVRNLWKSSNKVKRIPVLKEVMQHWEELDRQKIETEKPSLPTRKMAIKKTTIKKVEKIVVPKEEKVIFPVSVDVIGKNEFRLHNFGQDGVRYWVKIKGEVIAINKKNFDRNLDLSGVLNLQPLASYEEQKINFGYSAHGREISWIEKSFAVEPKKQKKKKIILPPAEESEDLTPEQPEAESSEKTETVIPFQMAQEDLAVAIGMENEGVGFGGEGNERQIRFSEEILILSDIPKMPFEIRVQLDPFQITSETKLIEELKKQLGLAVESFLEKKKEEGANAAALLEKEKKERAALKEKEAKEQKISEIKYWYDGVMISEKWSAVRENDIYFRHRIEFFQNESESPYAMVVRLKSQEGQGRLMKFNEVLPEGIHLNLDKNLSGEFITPHGSIKISFSSEKNPQLTASNVPSSEIKEIFLGMARAALHAFLVKFDKDSASYEKSVGRVEDERREIINVGLKKSAKNKLEAGKADVVLARDEKGFVSKIKRNVGREEAERLGGEILLKHAFVMFPRDGSAETTPEFDAEKYESFRELVDISSNKKYFIRRLQSTACEELDIPKDGNTAEALYDPRVIQIVREVVEMTDFSFEDLAKLEHASTLLDEEAGPYGNWIDVLISELENEKIPLISVRHALTCELEDLREEEK